MPDYARQRQIMVASQVLAGGATDERLLDAMGEIPRERFVPGDKRSIAYADAPLEVVNRRWLLAPATFARLVQLAVIAPGDNVLDVGCTTGYSTAVLAKLARRVVGLEEDADLVRIASEGLHAMQVGNAQIVQGALADGHPAENPYDVILVEGAMEQEPERLLAQLAEGGRLVGILHYEPQGHAMLYLKEYGKVGRRMAFDASAQVLAGFRAPAGFVF
ncbi:MAG TPA: protein-L-isoaspartate O-methyltransferase [Rhizomicrobium sp.]|jgi:protein-L-isoaspartate(D-aspartate) O-methyltransferase